MARWATGAKWAAGPAPGDQCDTPLVLSLSKGLGLTAPQNTRLEFFSKHVRIGSGKASVIYELFGTLQATTKREMNLKDNEKRDNKPS